VLGTPVGRAGISYREAHLVMELLAESGCLVALDLVEVNPIPRPREQTTPQLAAGLAWSGLGKRIFLSVLWLAAQRAMKRRVRVEIGGAVVTLGSIVLPQVPLIEGGDRPPTPLACWRLRPASSGYRFAPLRGGTTSGSSNPRRPPVVVAG